MSLMNASWFTKLNMFPYLIRNIHITTYNILYTMHSNIYQVSTEKISKDQFITEATFSDCDYSFFDWCANLPEEERNKPLTNLLITFYQKVCFQETVMNHEQLSITEELTIGKDSGWNESIKGLKPSHLRM